MLTPRVLTYWFMDDGLCYKGRYRLSTQGFTLREHKMLVKSLKKIFNLDFSIHKQSIYYTLALKSHCKGDFRCIIESFVLEGLQYKLD